MSGVRLNNDPSNRSLMSRRQNENRASPTPAEAHVLGLLSLMGEDYIFEKGIATPYSFFLVDFYFPKPRKLCLEIDGESHDDRVDYDRRRDWFIRNVRKMRLVRITNELALSLTCESLLRLLNDNSKNRE